MLKIWSMKQQQQKTEAAQGPAKKKKVTAAQLRVQKGEQHQQVLHSKYSVLIDWPDRSL